MKYYFLASYLPEIHREDTKIKISFSDLLEERFHIPREDWKEIELLLLGRDILILDGLLRGRDMEVKDSVFGPEFWREQIKAPGEGCPVFILELLRDLDTKTFGTRESDKLRGAYFNHVISNTTNGFLRGYFTFQRDLYNILAAMRARKKGLDPSGYIVGEGDLVERLKTSTAEDFGLEELYLESIKKADTPHQQQEAIDRILWDYLDDNTGPDIFHFNVILAYLLKLEILHKRLALSEEEGMEKVRHLGSI
ncbi:MAG TPA: DUF2764 family protein [Desulfatiglandales bacterium]|nr:DUF2764 family protein [Desulfatiglandales bacterium]